MSAENLNERIAALEKATEENGKTIWRVFEAIYGNGKPGLLAEVQALRHSVEAHHAEAKSNVGYYQWLITTVIAAAAVVLAWLK